MNFLLAGLHLSAKLIVSVEDTVRDHTNKPLDRQSSLVLKTTDLAQICSGFGSYLRASYAHKRKGRTIVKTSGKRKVENDMKRTECDNVTDGGIQT